MIKIGELLRKLWSLRSCFNILPPGALTPQGIEGAMKRDVSKHWCTLQWCASRGWFIAHENWTSWPVTRSFDVFFVLCLIKRLSKHSRGWLFETPSRPLWRHYNVKDLHTHNSHARVKIGVSFVSSNMVSFTFTIANWTVWKETKFHKLCRAFAFVSYIPQILSIQISISKRIPFGYTNIGWNKCIYIPYNILTVLVCFSLLLWLSILCHNDAIWWHRSGSILAQVMACFLTAPSHYLHQCSIILKGFLWHSPKTNFIAIAQDINS